VFLVDIGADHIVEEAGIDVRQPRFELVGLEDTAIVVQRVVADTRRAARIARIIVGRLLAVIGEALRIADQVQLRDAFRLPKFSRTKEGTGSG
jgi:hypothetical protein